MIGYDPYSGTFQHFSAEGIIKEVARAGYDAINMPFRPDFLDPESEESVETILGLIRDNGLATPSLGFTPHAWTTPGKGDEIRARMELAVKLAPKFNAKLITIWPNQPEGVSREDALKALTDNLKACVPIADDAGLAIAFEFEKGCPLDNYREAVEYVKETDERLRIVADTYHIWNDQAAPYEAVVAMKGLLGELHLSGSDRGEPGGPDDRFDYTAFMKGVKEVGFDGSIMVQYNLTDPASIERALRFARRITSAE